MVSQHSHESSAGVVALQGAFEAHVEMLARLGVRTREVRRAEDLLGLTHLVLPGGESTTIGHLLDLFDLWNPIRDAHARGELALLGTCAGAILLGHAPETECGEPGPARQPPRFACIDVDVERNAYGRQVDSFVHKLYSAPLKAYLRAVFIRAPRITRVGAGVRVLAELDGEAVAVETDGVLLTTFHPELEGDTTLHRRFLEHRPTGLPRPTGPAQAIS